MTELVALLRGVNVGGVRIRMAELAELARELGYDQVRPVLASGNLRFASEQDTATAKAQLESALRERFDYPAWVHVLTLEHLRELRDAYPFERGREGWHDYLVVVTDPAVLAELAAVETDPALERAAVGDGVLYWTVQKGSTLDSALGRAQASTRRSPCLTARNLNTVDRLLA